MKLHPAMGDRQSTEGEARRTGEASVNPAETAPLLHLSIIIVGQYQAATVIL